MVLHALDSDIFASLDGLGLEDFGEGTFALFTNQSVFLH